MLENCYESVAATKHRREGKVIIGSSTHENPELHAPNGKHNRCKMYNTNESISFACLTRVSLWTFMYQKLEMRPGAREKLVSPVEFKLTYTYKSWILNSYRILMRSTHYNEDFVRY